MKAALFSRYAASVYPEQIARMLRENRVSLARVGNATWEFQRAVERACALAGCDFEHWPPDWVANGADAGTLADLDLICNSDIAIVFDNLVLELIAEKRVQRVVCCEIDDFPFDDV